MKRKASIIAAFAVTILLAASLAAFLPNDKGEMGGGMTLPSEAYPA